MKAGPLAVADLAWLGPVPGRDAVVEGWLYAFGAGVDLGYLALVDEPPCCVGCLPRDPGRRVEVFAETALPVGTGKVTLAGELHCRGEPDAAGWRFQLRRARLAAPPRFGRRGVLGAVATLACAAVGSPANAAMDEAAARAVLSGAVTVDVHSHAGRVTGLQRVEQHAPFTPVAGPMREGGLGAVCLAAVSDAPTHRVMTDRRIHPFRDPAPGELYAYGQASFARIHDLAREQGLTLVATAADLHAAAARPAVVVSAEGGDFLEGQPARVDEAHELWTLRHLQLTHYRVNELGDIQTEPPVHGGLTDAGAEVIRRCNRLGVVVDVAHGTFDLVKRAAAVSTKPIVLSHTSLSQAPGPLSRLVSPDHARAVAGTGGLVGIWTPAGRFPDLTALAEGMARMVDAISVEHVALGSDMGGLVGPSCLRSYGELPGLCAALLARGFTAAEVRALLGGNYLRVFGACVG